MSVLEQLKKLEKQANELRAQAKKEAMAGVKAALASLNSLGHSYHLVEKSKDGPFPKKAPKAAKGITRKRDPNKPCDTCGFITNPPHDSRKHRAQGKSKKPFTAKELETHSLVKA